jgi:hypothetical protein
MLRSSCPNVLLLRSSCRPWGIIASPNSIGRRAVNSVLLRGNCQYPLQSRNVASGYNHRGGGTLRFLSSNSGSNSNTAEKTKTEQAKPNTDGEEDTKEIVLTPGETVVAVSRLGLWAGIAAFATVCAYYIGKELFPS